MWNGRFQPSPHRDERKDKGDMILTTVMNIFEFYNRICNLLWFGKWIFCYHEDKDIEPISFADWKCSKCGIEL